MNKKIKFLLFGVFVWINSTMGQSGQYWYQQAQLAEDPSEQEYAYSKAISKDSSYYEAFLGRGMVYVEMDEYNKALEDFRRAMKLNQSDPKLHEQMCYGYAEIPDYESAFRACDTALKMGSKELKVSLYRGMIHLHYNRMNEAMKDFSHILEWDTTIFNAYIGRAQVYMHRNELDSALSDLDKAIEMDSESDMAYTLRGRANYKKEDYLASLMDFKKVADKDSSNIDALLMSARLIRLCQFPPEIALNYFEIALLQDPDNFSVIYERGIHHYITNDYDNAILDFDAAIQIDSKSVFSYLYKAMSYYYTESYIKAILDFDKVIQMDFYNAVAYHYRGRSKLILHRYTEAIRDFDRAIEIKPDELYFYSSRALAKENLGLFDEALADYSIHLSADPSYRTPFDGEAFDRNFALTRKSKERDSLSSVKSKTFAIILGITNYKYPNRLFDSEYFIENALRMTRVVERDSDTEYKDVTMLLNERASRQNILSVLEKYLNEEHTYHPKDQLFFYFGGRSRIFDEEIGLYPYDYFNQGSVVDLGEVLNLFKKSSSKKKLIILELSVAEDQDLSLLKDSLLKRLSKIDITFFVSISKNGQNSGNSVLINTLLEALAFEADNNYDDTLTIQELEDYVMDKMSIKRESNEIFLYHVSQDFVFLRLE